MTFPEAGLAAPSDDRTWPSSTSGSRLALATGSSDVAGALLDAARRLEREWFGASGYIGDGSPTSGELSAATVAARVRPVLRERKADLRFLGAGRAVDEVVVAALAESLGATYEPVITGESIESALPISVWLCEARSFAVRKSSCPVASPKFTREPFATCASVSKWWSWAGCRPMSRERSSSRAISTDSRTR